MKIVPNRIFYILLMLLTGVTAFTRNKPPPPGVPPPPGLPIDGGVVVLLILAIVYGLYRLYQFKLNKKTLI